MDARKQSNLASLGDIEDLIHNFLIIMLEHSMRQKDGWKVCLYPYFPLYCIFKYTFVPLNFKHVSSINIFWSLFPFYRILKLQFIVQNGSLSWVDLALGIRELGITLLNPVHDLIAVIVSNNIPFSIYMWLTFSSFSLECCIKKAHLWEHPQDALVQEIIKLKEKSKSLYLHR